MRIQPLDGLSSVLLREDIYQFFSVVHGDQASSCGDGVSSSASSQLGTSYVEAACVVRSNRGRALLGLGSDRTTEAHGEVGVL
jgi:hypothetical protein